MKKKCEVCGKGFSVKPYRADVARYCSMKCKGIASRGIFYGAGFQKGGTPWNKNLKGIRLSPNSEFKKGHKPWNKNVKGIHLSTSTEFKKGIIPENKMEVGSITKRIEVNGNNRNWIKIEEPNIWQPLYRYLWENKNGEVPEGMVVHHRNFIPDDDRIENLEIMTRADHLIIHKK